MTGTITLGGRASIRQPALLSRMQVAVLMEAEPVEPVSGQRLDVP